MSSYVYMTFHRDTVDGDGRIFCARHWVQAVVIVIDPFNFGELRMLLCVLVRLCVSWGRVLWHPLNRRAVHDPSKAFRIDEVLYVHATSLKLLFPQTLISCCSVPTVLGFRAVAHLDGRSLQGFSVRSVQELATCRPKH